MTSRAAWNSQAPESFRRVAATPSYVLWKRTGPMPPDRHVLLEGTAAGAPAGCASPEIRILLAGPGRASLFPAPVIGGKARWGQGSVLGAGARTSQDAGPAARPSGTSRCSTSPPSPSPSRRRGFSEPLEAALDGQRPNTISLANDGQFWPAGRFVSEGGRVEFTIEAEEASAMQSLSGYDGKAYVGGLVAVPVAPHRLVPLSGACDGWIDWYESSAAP